MPAQNHLWARLQSRRAPNSSSSKLCGLRGRDLLRAFPAAGTWFA